MASEAISTSNNLASCCNCGCSCSWLRPANRKHDEAEDVNQLVAPGMDQFSVARVQIKNECAALREMVNSQQQNIQSLYTELEEERNASASAANEAMSMILRLQGEKAEIQMEARQFKRFAEDKMSHDQELMLELEDMLYKREQTIHALTCEVQAYKHRMMSFGLTEDEVVGGREFDAHYDLPTFEYPPLKCGVNGIQEAAADDETDIEKYAFGETPRDQLKNLENRISEMERTPTHSQMDRDLGGNNILEKVVVGNSPRPTRHSRRFSSEAWSDISADYLKPYPSFHKIDYVCQPEDQSNWNKLDNMSEGGEDVDDRVYTIDSVHSRAPNNAVTKDKAGDAGVKGYVTTPMNNADMEDPDIQKLSLRLQALEADRESMRQVIISMQTEKAQLVLLKEIAQHLCKDVSPEKRVVIKKPSADRPFSFISTFKWASWFVFWKKKALRSKYTFDLSTMGEGLLMLLNKGGHERSWRCLRNTQVPL